MIPDSIIIEGTVKQGRYPVIIDGIYVYLQPVGFRFFSILGLRFLTGENDGWIKAAALYQPQEIVPRYIYRIREDVYSQVKHLRCWTIFENSRRNHSYRLIAKSGTVRINFSNLKNFGCHDLIEMVDRYLGLN